MAESRQWAIVVGLLLWSGMPIGITLGLWELRRQRHGVTIDVSQPIHTVSEPVLEPATPSTQEGERG